METTQCDDLVVGAGSVGAVVVSRLSESPEVSVMLLEARESTSDHPVAWIPAGSAHMLGPAKIDTDQMTVVGERLRVHGIDRLRLRDATRV